MKKIKLSVILNPIVEKIIISRKNVGVRYSLVFLLNVGQDLSCAMSGKFGAAFAGIGYYKKINRPKIKIAEK